MDVLVVLSHWCCLLYMKLTTRRLRRHGLLGSIIVTATRKLVSRQLRLFLRCCGNATTPLLTPALNHATNIISRHQRELRQRLLSIATSMTLLIDLESLLESFLGKYRRSEPLP